MDTKWRNSNIVRVARVVLFILVITSLSLAVMNFRNFIMRHEGNLDIVFESDYMNNFEYKRERETLFGDLKQLVVHYKNEEYIKNGRAITMADVINHDIPPYHREFKDSSKYDFDKSEEANYQVFKELYPEEIKAAKKDIIKTQLQSFNNTKTRLAEYKDIYYYASNGEDVFTNNPSMKEEDFLKEPGYFMYDYDNGLRKYPRDQEYRGSYYDDRWYESIDSNSETKIYIGFTEEYFNRLEKEWKKEKEDAMKIFRKFLTPLIIMLLGFILEIILLPSSEEEGKYRLIDRPYTDISLFMSGSLIFGFLAFLTESDFVADELIILTTVAIASLGLYLVLSIVRNIKNKRFFSHSLLGKIFLSIKNFIVGIYRSGSFEKRIVFLVILYPLIVGLSFFIFPITIGLVAWYALKKAKDFTRIREGVKKVKNGDLSHKIDIEKKGEFKDLAEDINSISEGLDQAIDNELKSERHKAELITNVSHDIRTPLTSIITYVDLLKNEEDQVKREEYIGILETKAARLKTLTDDLFEASKVSSGNIPVNLSKIDIVSLLTQGLGELNDDIESQGLEFIVNSDRESMDVLADGELLWRAIENLLSNIFKYSLADSRVYIDIKDEGDRVKMTMKNISAYRLNISADELMERFKRGDESRSSEGSGLGLSIAESLIELQEGSFSLEIDGDLFKTDISLKKYK